MSAERTSMRQVREVVRLKFVGGVPSREIARRIGAAPSTVRTTIERFRAPMTLAASPQWAGSLFAGRGACHRQPSGRSAGT